MTKSSSLKTISPTPPLYVDDPESYIEQIKTASTQISVKKAWANCKKINEKK